MTMLNCLDVQEVTPIQAFSASATVIMFLLVLLLLASINDKSIVGNYREYLLIASYLVLVFTSS